MRAVLVVMVMVLAGCAATPAELAAEDDATCTGYGFTPQTTDYAICRMSVAQGRESQANARKAAWFAGTGARLITAPRTPQP